MALMVSIDAFERFYEAQRKLGRTSNEAFGDALQDAIAKSGGNAEEVERALKEAWAEKHLPSLAKLIKIYCKERPACEDCVFCTLKGEELRCMFIKDDFKPPFPNEWEIPGEE